MQVKTVSDQVRDLIEKSGVTRYRISQDTGIAESVLSRFMAGRGLNTETLDRLGVYFGVTVHARRSPTSGSHKHKRK